MGYRAFILICCVLAYIGERIVLPGGWAMRSSGAYESCFGGIRAGSAHSKYPNEGKDKHEKNGYSVLCPLTYTMIMPVNNEVVCLVLVSRRAYPSFQSSYVYGYVTDAWKPPVARA